MRPVGPDFFIVGAPKCGTTALHTYLSVHPEIYMASEELHFFGSDLEEFWNRPDGAGRAAMTASSSVGRPEPAEYFGAFAGTDWAACRGERSNWYLWSRRAAAEIHEYNPRAKIIAMLRNPVDFLASLHSQYLRDQIEDIESFEEALAAEADRRAGKRIPPHNSRTYPWRLFYIEVARFHEQLTRYFAVFDPEQIYVILYDDFAVDTLGSYQGVLAFLGVEPTFAPPELPVINPNKRNRSRNLQRLVWQMEDPRSRLRRIGTRVIPYHGARSALLRSVPSAMRRFNSVEVPRPPVNSGVRMRIIQDLRDEVLKLEDLLERDLTHWLGEVEAHKRDPVSHTSGRWHRHPGEAST